nr:hypothetical protein [Tanacetum cinerariifolium]
MYKNRYLVRFDNHAGSRAGAGTDDDEHVEEEEPVEETLQQFAAVVVE